MLQHKTARLKHRQECPVACASWVSAVPHCMQQGWAGASHRCLCLCHHPHSVHHHCPPAKRQHRVGDMPGISLPWGAQQTAHSAEYAGLSWLICSPQKVRRPQEYRMKSATAFSTHERSPDRENSAFEGTGGECSYVLRHAHKVSCIGFPGGWTRGVKRSRARIATMSRQQNHALNTTDCEL